MTITYNYISDISCLHGYRCQQGDTLKKSGFTLIELIIVIIVAGILAAVMIPRLERDNLREAANQVVRHIQYTQHLAMMNDVYDASDTDWREKRWAIDLCSTAYSIARADDSEVAEDPLTQRDINGTDNNLANKGVNYITPNTGCKIVFDNLGRPYGIDSGTATTVSTDLLPTVTIRIKPDSGSTRYADINITKETGYVSLITLI